MPGLWKKPAVSRLLSRLRSKRASSPLVVETGFPTSLADLVVKHRARLRSRKPPSPPPAATAAPPPQLPPIGCTTEAVAVEVRCIAPTAPLETRKTRWFRFRFRFLAATLLVLALMVIGWRGLVSGITVSAFVLLLFDFLGFRVFEFLWHRSRGSGLVSPAREVGVEEESELLQNCEGLVADAEVLLERRDLAVVGSDENMVCLGSGCLKKEKKKLWKQFLPKKIRRRRSGRAREEIETNSCSSSQIVSGYEQDELSIEQEEWHIDEGVPNEEACMEVSYRDRVDVVDMEGNDARKTNLCSSRQIILIVVVLLGLLRGRSMALVVAIGWFLVTRSVDILWRKWKAYRSQ